MPLPASLPSLLPPFSFAPPCPSLSLSLPPRAPSLNVSFCFSSLLLSVCPCVSLPPSYALGPSPLPFSLSPSFLRLLPPPLPSPPPSIYLDLSVHLYGHLYGRLTLFGFPACLFIREQHEAQLHPQRGLHLSLSDASGAFRLNLARLLPRLSEQNSIFSSAVAGHD